MGFALCKDQQTLKPKRTCKPETESHLSCIKHPCTILWNMPCLPGPWPQQCAQKLPRAGARSLARNGMGLPSKRLYRRRRDCCNSWFLLRSMNENS